MTKDPVSQKVTDQLPSQLPGREAVRELLLSLKVPNSALVPAICSRLLSIGREAPWLFERGTSVPGFEIRRGLGELAALDRRRLDFRGRTELFPRAATLATQYPIPPPAHERLRGLFVLGCWSRLGRHRRRKVPAASLDQLGSFIRGLDRQRVHGSTEMALSAIARLDDLTAISETLENGWASDFSGIAESWRNVWVPWIADLPNRQVLDSADTASPAPPVRVRFSPRASEPGFGGHEAPAEIGPEFDYLPPKRLPRGVAPPSKAFEALFSHQASRGRNRWLLKRHVTVASDTEIRLLISQADRDFGQTADTIDKATIAITLLHIATGRALPSLMDTHIHPYQAENPEQQHLYLDIEAGTFTAPVLQPPDIYRPSAGALLYLEPISDQIQLYLPPTLIGMMRKMHAHRTAKRVTDWLDGIDPEARILSYLNTISGLPHFGRGISRYRTWLPAQIQSVGLDLAKTMLICGDEFGRSNAPLYYYSPRHAELQGLYRQAVWPVFGDSPPEVPIPGGEDRLGPAHVVKMAVARKGGITLSNRTNEDAGRLYKTGGLPAVEFHNRLTNYLAHYIAVITSNRPHSSLYRLTRWSFDTSRHLAILDDKKIDPAHFTRLTCLTPRLSQQIDLYLGHLERLREAVWAPPSLRQTITEILQGAGPLLLYLDPDLRAREGTRLDWISSRPPAWSAIEDNWYRAFTSTRLREAGAPAASVLSHHGHLEAVAYAFSSESPVPPLELMARLRPALIGVEKALGFRVVRGFVQSSYESSLPALKSWDDDIAAHELAGKKAAVEAARIKRASIKKNRLAAVHWLLEQAHSVDSKLGEVLQWLHRYPGRKAVPEEFESWEIDDSSVERLLEAAKTSLTDDDSLPIAIHNQLCRWLRDARRRMGAIVSDIGLIVAAPQTELSPFPLGACLASMQVQAARTHLVELFRSKTAVPDEIRRALGLVLYAGVSCAEDIARRCVTNRNWVSVESVRGVLLNQQDAQPSGLSGLAMLPFFGRESGTETVLPVEELSRQLASFFPVGWVGAEPRTFLQRLCSTVGMAARIEQSGLARYVTSKNGAVSASAESQSAYLSRRSAVSGAPTSFDSPVVSAPFPLIENQKSDEGRYSERARAGSKLYYDRLHRAVTDPRHFLQDSKNRPSGEARPQYTVSLAEVKAALNVIAPVTANAVGGSPLSINQALAAFAKDMVENGTQYSKFPANTTIATYLSAIGPELVEAFGGFDLRNLLPEDFEDGYQLVLAVKLNNRAARSTCERAAAQLLHFHNLLVRECGIPEISSRLFSEYLPIEEDQREAVLISDRQYGLALRWLQNQFDPNRDHPLEDVAWRRQCQSAAVGLILLRRSGGRIGEISWLRHADLVIVSSRLLLAIRPSTYRRLKTAAGRRLLDLTERLTSDERILIETWCNGERRRLGDQRDSCLLLGSFEDAYAGIGAAGLRSFIQAAFHYGAGCDMWPHLLRHAWYSEELPVAAGCGTSPTMLTVDPETIRRQTQETTAEAGHSAATTGGRYYFHLPWMLLNTPPRSIGETDSVRWLLAGLSRLSVDNVDKIRQRFVVSADSQTEPLVTTVRWIDAVTERTVRPPVAMIPQAEFDRPFSRTPGLPMTPWTLDRILQAASDIENLPIVAGPAGLSTILIQRLQRACASLAKETYYRLLPTISRRGRLIQDPIPREVDAEVLSALDEPIAPVLAKQIHILFCATYSPFQARHDRLRGTPVEIHALVDLLEKIGIDHSLFRVTQDGGFNHLSIAGRRDDQISLFHRLIRKLAVVSVWSQLDGGELGDVQGQGQRHARNERLSEP